MKIFRLKKKGRVVVAQFACPKCKTVLHTKPKQGATVRCPKCEAKIKTSSKVAQANSHSLAAPSPAASSSPKPESSVAPVLPQDSLKADRKKMTSTRQGLFAPAYLVIFGSGGFILLTSLLCLVIFTRLSPQRAKPNKAQQDSVPDVVAKWSVPAASTDRISEAVAKSAAPAASADMTPTEKEKPVNDEDGSTGSGLRKTAHIPLAPPEWFAPGTRMRLLPDNFIPTPNMKWVEGRGWVNPEDVPPPGDLTKEALEKHFTHYVIAKAPVWVNAERNQHVPVTIEAGKKIIQGEQRGDICLICSRTEDNRPLTMYVQTRYLRERHKGPPTVTDGAVVKPEPASATNSTTEKSRTPYDFGFQSGLELGRQPARLYAEAENRSIKAEYRRVFLQKLSQFEKNYRDAARGYGEASEAVQQLKGRADGYRKALQDGGMQ